MWRRACLGNVDDALTLGGPVLAAAVGLLLVTAGTWGWGAGMGAVVAPAGMLAGLFAWRRRRWDRFVRERAEVGIRQLELMLGRQRRR